VPRRYRRRQKESHAIYKNRAARGYAETPVVNLFTIERTSEFYAAGRLTYEQTATGLSWKASIRQLMQRSNEGNSAGFHADSYVYKLTESKGWIVERVATMGGSH